MNKSGRLFYIKLSLSYIEFVYWFDFVYALLSVNNIKQKKRKMFLFFLFNIGLIKRNKKYVRNISQKWEIFLNEKWFNFYLYKTLDCLRSVFTLTILS